MKKVIAVCETKMNELPNSCVWIVHFMDVVYRVVQEITQK